MQNVRLGGEPLDGSSSAALELTASEVSKMLGIPIPTMRAWERRYGWPNPHRTHGGHRRYAGLEVSQLRALRDEIASGRPPQDAVHLLRAIEGRRVERFVTPLLDAASGHDADSVQRVLAELDREMDYERAVQAVIIPALRGVGDRWQAGSCDVLGEHLLTAAARRWISRGAEGLRPASGGRVFLSTAPFENHTVALEAFAVLLSRRGWGCVMPTALGRNEHLVDAARSSEPDVVVIVAHRNTSRSRAVQTLRGIKALGVQRIFYAGNGFASSRARRGVPGTLLPPDLLAATEVVEHEIAA
ncbi:MAG: MerR family transcriptional regulator [Actinomycetota bacterium]